MGSLQQTVHPDPCCQVLDRLVEVIIDDARASLQEQPPVPLEEHIGSLSAASAPPVSNTPSPEVDWVHLTP